MLKKDLVINIIPIRICSSTFCIKYNRGPKTNQMNEGVMGVQQQYREKNKKFCIHEEK